MCVCEKKREKIQVVGATLPPFQPLSTWLVSNLHAKPIKIWSELPFSPHLVPRKHNMQNGRLEKKMEDWAETEGLTPKALRDQPLPLLHTVDYQGCSFSRPPPAGPRLSGNTSGPGYSANETTHTPFWKAPEHPQRVRFSSCLRQNSLVPSLFTTPLSLSSSAPKPI